MLAQSTREDLKTVTGSWGWFLAAGIGWIVFSFFVLSFNYRTVWAIALFFGIGFIMGGFMELAVAAVAPGWKWLYIAIGIVSIVAGVIALAWPGQTFLVLSALAGWLLFFYGIIDVVFAFSTRRVESLWWTQLVTGIIMILLGFWAISPDAQTVSTYRGSVLLVVWIGVAALFRGISDTIVGFRLRSARGELGGPAPA
ncbi:MAG: HdeD family acid-resistance protein [Acidimicrobiia bacterium]